MPEPPLAPSPLPPPPAPAEDVWSVDERSLKVFAEQLRGAPAERSWYDLRREAERIALVPGFDRLVTLDANAIKELPHQIDAAQRGLRDMGRPAILADEEGLRRTSEESRLCQELRNRDIARRAL